MKIYSSNYFLKTIVECVFLFSLEQPYYSNDVGIIIPKIMMISNSKYNDISVHRMYIMY